MEVRTQMRRLVLAAAVLVGSLALPVTVSAHNAGHVLLPDSSCLNIGSFRDAPLLGNGEQLDLVPGTPNPPYDEIGVSFVGYWGRTPIYPGPCPV
jgi:hypothetical protein